MAKIKKREYGIYTTKDKSIEVARKQITDEIKSIADGKGEGAVVTVTRYEEVYNDEYNDGYNDWYEIEVAFYIEWQEELTDIFKQSEILEVINGNKTEYLADDYFRKIED